MTVDASVPLDSVFGSLIASYVRETREFANELEAAIGLAVAPPTQSDVDMTPGQTALIVGSHLSAVAVQVCHINSATAETVGSITFGDGGQVVVFVAEGNNVTIGHDGVNITLNGDDDLPLQTNDVLVLANVGGAGDGVTDGNWVEVARSLRV